VYLDGEFGKGSNDRGVVDAVTSSRAMMSNIRQNILFAGIYNAAGIPIAAGQL
jgi:Cu+-exporting ATPase